MDIVKTAHTVDTVDTVHTVDVVHAIHTADIVHNVHTLDTVHATVLLMDIISQKRNKGPERARDRDKDRERDRYRDRNRDRDQASIDVVCCYVLVLCLGLAGLLAVPCLASFCSATTAAAAQLPPAAEGSLSLIHI